MAGMRMYSIASGSSGNCIYVGSTATHLLIDVGISCKRTEEGLRDLELCGRDIDGILVTHEHSDHIAGLSVLSRKYDIPIYASKGTIDWMKKDSKLKCLDEELFHVVAADEKFTIKDLVVNPMIISHDAAQPLAYRVAYGTSKVAVCTDLGYFNDYTVESLKGMNALLLESNHDVNMLQVGHYPYYLKQRILGNQGHLSNENSGRLLSKIAHDGLETILLGHLSKDNNLPELAYEAVRMEINLSDCPYQASDFRIEVAKRSEPTPVVNV